MVGEIKNDEIRISLWLMSFRVFKRGIEYAMFDHFVRRFIALGLKSFKEIYLNSAKNGMVSGLCNGDSIWLRKTPDSYENRNHLIEVLK
jgi:predicted enzyme involved in methoxymalonyl-ACP biosynthesis